MMSSLNDLSSLTPSQEKTLTTILNILHGRDTNKKSQIRVTLAEYPFDYLYAFSEKSPELNKLFETDPYLNTSWSERLKKRGYLYDPITSFDKKSMISVFSQLK